MAAINRRRPAEVHDLATPLGIGSEDAVIDDEVYVGAWNQRGELFEQLQRLKGDMARPVAPRRLEPHEHVSIGPKGQTVFGKRPPQQIPAEPLELPAVLGTDGGVGMKVEAAKPRLSTTPPFERSSSATTSSKSAAASGTLKGGHGASGSWVLRQPRGTSRSASKRSGTRSPRDVLA